MSVIRDAVIAQIKEDIGTHMLVDALAGTHLVERDEHMLQAITQPVYDAYAAEFERISNLPPEERSRALAAMIATPVIQAAIFHAIGKGVSVLKTKIPGVVADGLSLVSTEGKIVITPEGIVLPVEIVPEAGVAPEMLSQDIFRGKSNIDSATISKATTEIPHGAPCSETAEGIPVAVRTREEVATIAEAGKDASSIAHRAEQTVAKADGAVTEVTALPKKGMNSNSGLEEIIVRANEGMLPTNRELIDFISLEKNNFQHVEMQLLEKAKKRLTTDLGGCKQQT